MSFASLTSAVDLTNRAIKTLARSVALNVAAKQIDTYGYEDDVDRTIARAEAYEKWLRR